MLGTPAYMSPEQCRGASEIDERADIYALGCILFEMLCGGPPFMGESVQELIALHMFRAAPAIGERVPGLPAWLAGLVTAMLAKKREERPTSMHGVARALGEGMRTKAAQIGGRCRDVTRGARGGRPGRGRGCLHRRIGAGGGDLERSRSSGLPTRARPLRGGGVGRLAGHRA